MQSTQQFQQQSQAQQRAHKHPYRNLVLMLLTSIVSMYCLSYLNTYKLDHIFFSQTRVYMAILMGCGMSLIMLAFMARTMFKDAKANIIFVVATLAVFCASLALMRSQMTVDDVSYMEAMIPHHSIAILTSNRAQIRDPRVRALADKISQSQTKEIAEMKALIQDIKANGVAQSGGVAK